MKLHRALLRAQCAALDLLQLDHRGEVAELATLHNRLPNSGGFTPTATIAQQAEEVVRGVSDGARRSVGEAGFEGLALDDALAYTSRWKHFSFFRQSRAIDRIARQVATGAATVLELGCGGGDMGHFLGILGVPGYVGVEGNALAFRFSPFIAERPRHFHCLNLQQEIDFGRAFTVVCSFEVLEHIPESSLDGILATIRNHMGPNSVFLGTASLQDDLDVHVTVRERGFWLAAFARHGLVPHENASWQREIEAGHAFNWHAGNTNVFVLKRSSR